MKRTIKIDEFFSRQPDLSFVEYLRSPVHVERPKEFGTREMSEVEVEVRDMYLDIAFPDDNKLLETAYADFNKFLKIYSLEGNRYPVKVRKGNTKCFEAYNIQVSETECTITSNDTEGIRRALIYIEDELQIREGGFLPIGEVSRSPHMHARITRGFFSPTNRPPKFGDELSDDIDYYPDEYLNRLAHDGTNGLWIYTSFAALLPSEYITEFGKGHEKRIKKLNRVIQKCAKYGIKVYVFAIEPMAFRDEQLIKEYPQVLGNNVWYNDQRTFCTHSEFGKNYCLEATQKLFEFLPDLAGYINITYGERPTSCASSWTGECPRCSKYTQPEVLAYSVDLLREGIRRVKPEADYVSWTYGHRQWDEEDIREYVRQAPDDVMLMQNFEDRGYAQQLGKTRIAIDYWLSYTGPSEMFEITAEQAIESGKHMWAKMQVCSSHELSTVPYIPAPGLVYTKFKEAHRLKVEGVMECWYFGNYPSIMSKAAGELAFEHDFDDKDAFLRRLAGIYWGNSKAETVLNAWKKFEEGYFLYPLNIMFSYYGPMHDGVVWELALKPRNFSLSRSWLLLDKPDGDRISESLFYGHSLDEAITLVEGICENWAEGIKILDDILLTENEDRKEQVSVIKALSVLFNSGKNILKFYKLRDLLGRQIDCPNKVINELRNIVYKEIDNSKAMIELCELDGRLGYHSEAEGYKFFPEKLRHRISTLEELLNTEFPEVEKRIIDGLPPLEYYLGIEEGSKSYHLSSSGLENADWESLKPLKPLESVSDSSSKFRAAYDDDNVYYEFVSNSKTSFRICNEFELMWPSPTMIIDENGKLEHSPNSNSHQSLFGDKLDQEAAKWKIEAIPSEGTHIKVSLKRKDFNWIKNTPYKLRVVTKDGAIWCVEEDPVLTLGKGDISPGQFGWMMP